MVRKGLLSAIVVVGLASVALGQPPARPRAVVFLPPQAEEPSPPPVATLSRTTTDPTPFAPPAEVDNRFWARSEYLVWWLNGSRLPPLVTASPPGTDRTQAGLIGSPGTVVLFGDESVNNEARSGVRLQVGMWCDNERTFGIQASGFLLEGKATSQVAGPDGIVARPFTNAQTGLPDAELVAFPGVLAGTVAAAAGSGNLLGADVLLRQRVCCGCSWRLDGLLGYRYLRFADSVSVQEVLSPQTDPFVPGTQLLISDAFRARNTFHGAAMGLAFEYDTAPWILGMTARVNVGEVFRDVSIAGSTTAIVPGAPTVVNTGGLLAQTTNIGTFRSVDWTAVPELDLHVRYRIRNNVSLTAGYSFLCMPSVARSGEQIDTTVNRTLIPPSTGNVTGPARPAFVLNESNLWTQGFAIGLEWDY